jgi:uncharacterized membrane protein YgaE (UPF0421/DUF939 family)
MKYTIRAIKYFFRFAFLATAIILALVFIGIVEADINAIFEHGYDDLWKIAVFFGVVAAVYPNLAFINRQVAVDGERNTVKEDIKRFMLERHYDLESEDAEGMTFRIHGLAGKLSKMYEDRITIRWNSDGFTMEGLRKDILRLATGLETSFLN